MRYVFLHHHLLAGLALLLAGCAVSFNKQASSSSTATLKLVFTTSSQALTAGNCSGVVTVEMQSLASAASVVSTPASIALSATAGTGTTFYSDACTTVATSVTIPAGQSSANLYFKTLKKGAVTITGTDGSSTTTAATQNHTINPNVPAKLGFSTQPSATGTAGTALTQQPVVSVLDTHDNVVDSATDSITLSAHTNATCTSAAGGTLTVTTNPVAANGTDGTATFAGVKHTIATTLFLKAASGSLSGCSNGIVLGAGAADRIAFVTAPTGPAAAGSPITTQPEIGIQDANGNNIAGATNNVTIFSRVYIGIDNNCSAGTPNAVTATTSPLAPNASGVAQFSGVTVNRAGSYRLRFTSSGMATTNALCSSAFVIDGGAPFQVILTGPSQVTQNQCVPFQVSVRDTYRNRTIISTTLSTNIALTASAGAFHTDSACAGGNVTTIAAIPANASSVTVYYQDPNAAPASRTLTADGTVPGLGTDTFTVSTVAAISADLKIVLGESFACSLMNAGVKCWGEGSAGQLGNGAGTDSYTPVAVTGLSAGIADITAGGQFACALLSGTGEVMCWGNNDQGQIGDNTSSNTRLSPVFVKNKANTGNLTGVTSMDAGQLHVCAVVPGEVLCWGYNSLGMLGSPGSGLSSSSIPVQALAATATHVSAGYRHTCAVVDQGVKCWGWGTYHRLGYGSATSTATPQDVTGLVPGTAAGVTAVSAGFAHTCAIVSGTAYCWGYDSNGAVGNGAAASTDVAAPQSTGLANVVKISSNTRTCAVISDGSARCWGRNDLNQTGFSSSGGHLSSPTSFASFGVGSGVTYIETSDSSDNYGFTCFVVSGGIRCVGDNRTGLLGDSTWTDRTTHFGIHSLN